VVQQRRPFHPGSSQLALHFLATGFGRPRISASGKRDSTRRLSEAGVQPRSDGYRRLPDDTATSVPAMACPGLVDRLG
jgi:hypothetical protein